MSLRRCGQAEEREHERAEILAALEASKGRVKNVTERLGVCRRRVYKYLYRFDLWSELERIRQESIAEDEERVERAARTLRELVPSGEPAPELRPRAASRAPVWWKTRKKASPG